MSRFVFWLALLLLAGCEDVNLSQRQKQEHEFRMSQAKVCNDRGGVAILSGWTGLVVDCKFPQEPTQRAALPENDAQVTKTQP